MELILSPNHKDLQVIPVAQQNTKQSLSVEQVVSIQTLSLDTDAFDDVIKNSIY